MNRKQKLQLAAACAAITTGAMGQFARATNAVVYSDNFDNRTTLSGTYVYTTSSGTHAAGGDDGALITPGGTGNNTLKLTNDAAGNGTTGASAAPLFASTPTSAYTNGFNNVFSANTGSKLVWTLNLQNNVANPSGFAVAGSGNTGQAYVLGSTSSDFYDTGAQGYMVAVGETSGNPDPITA